MSNATPSGGKTEVHADTLEIDAGVIFSDRASYLCIPLSRFGLSSAESIESIVTLTMVSGETRTVTVRFLYAQIFHGPWSKTGPVSVLSFFRCWVRLRSCDPEHQQ